MTNEDKALIKETSDLLKQLKPLLNKVDKFIYQPIDTTEGEQEQGKEWKPEVGEWGKFGKYIYLVVNIDLQFYELNDQSNNVVAHNCTYPISYMPTKPTTEEIKAHLVSIADKKYPVGAKVKSHYQTNDLITFTIADWFEFEYADKFQRLCIDGMGAYELWNPKDGWAEIIPEIIAPIETEQRWMPEHGEEVYAANNNPLKFIFTNQAWHLVMYEAGMLFKTEEKAIKHYVFLLIVNGKKEAIKQYLSINQF
jgi:hypothetical protein